MQTLSEIRTLLAERGLRPKHRLGQNFLHDQNQVRRLLAAAGVGADDVVLEVGPGTGTLTEALLESGARVVASEIDDAMADLVEDRLVAEVNAGRLTLVRGDCLAKQRRVAPAVLDAVGAGPFRLVANLPYQVASPLIVALLLDHPACTGQFVTIQREVADRLLAPPGGKIYGALGVIVQALATVERIANVPASCFWPPPKVTSAMVAIRPRPEHGVADAHGFARFVTDLFGRRRKQLGSIFGRDRTWPEGVTPELRPEALAVPRLLDLWRAVGSDGPSAEDR